MVLKYNISPSAFIEDFEIHIWEATNDVPGGEVVVPINIPAPHVAPFPVTVNGLDKVVHILRMYGVTTATLLHEVNLEPQSDILTVFAPIRFKIGDGGPNTPSVGTAGYQNDLLIGLTADQYTVTRNNYGLLHPGIHYDLTDPAAGIFNLLQVGDVWGDADEVTIQIVPQGIATVVNDSVVAKLFGQTPSSDDVFVDIVGSISYDAATHLRKLLRLHGAAEFNFDSNPPLGYGFTFNHFASETATGKINFNNAPLLWGATTKTSLDMADLSSACFIFDGTFWNVVFTTAGASSGAKTILGAGLFPVGDITTLGDVDYVITHNLAIVGDYLVLWNVKTNNPTNVINPVSRAFDNDVVGTWFHHPTNKANQFVVSLQEKAAGLQDMSIAWIIIQL